MRFVNSTDRRFRINDKPFFRKATNLNAESKAVPTSGRDQTIAGNLFGAQQRTKDSRHSQIQVENRLMAQKLSDLGISDQVFVTFRQYSQKQFISAIVLEVNVIAIAQRIIKNR